MSQSPSQTETFCLARGHAITRSAASNSGGKPHLNSRPHRPESERENRNHGTKLLSNNDKLRNQHLELSSPQTQMLRCQCKERIKKSQGDMSPAEASSSTEDLNIPIQLKPKKKTVNPNLWI